MMRDYKKGMFGLHVKRDQNKQNMCYNNDMASLSLRRTSAMVKALN